MSKRNKFPGMLVCLVWTVGYDLPAFSQTPTRPNIILMMADDMGWADMDFAIRLGEDSNGGDVNYSGTSHWNTPNLSAMASNGLTFSRMYSSSPVCSPTRASVLTGRSPERTGVSFANTGSLQNREVTVAEYAQTLGYQTGHFGKWHLGVLTRDIQDANRGGDAGSHNIYSTPLNSGFDVEYSTESKTSTYDPGTSGLTPTTRYWTGPGQFVPLTSPDLQGDDSAIIARETNAFIQQSAQDNDPFLAVSWFHTPHKPINTPGNQDVDNLAAYRFAMEDLDAAVGQIRSKVQELGIADNTILLFTSDNGPEDGQDYNNEGLRNNKRELHEGGVRVPGLIEWQGQVTPGITHTPMVTTDYLPTLMDIWGVGPVDARPMDGTSMAETIFTDRAATREKTIIFKSTNGHQSAMGSGGRYKLISTNNGSSWNLYDIVRDYDENAPVATSGNVNQADPAIQAIYQQLLEEYNAWTTSVATSTSGGITGDYQTRVTQVSDGQLLSEPPQNIEQGTVTNADALVYLERQYATISEELTLDSDGEIGSYTVSSNATLEVDSVVHSYLVHFDPTTAGSTSAMEITFDDEILGVIGESALLADSDYLSFADPDFEQSITRGLEAVDSWIISNNGRTITFDLTASPDAMDELRVLTRAELEFVEIVFGDLNADGMINASDWVIYKNGFGQDFSGLTSQESYAMGDLNGDLINDHTDFALFRNAFNQLNGTGAFASMLQRVPEPSSAAILVFSLSAFKSLRLWGRESRLADATKNN